MIAIEALGLDDIIEPTDLVRQTYSHLEYDIKVSEWMEASIYMPAWVGKTLREYYTFFPGEPVLERNHQIMRVPKSLRKAAGFVINEKYEIG